MLTPCSAWVTDDDVNSCGLDTDGFDEVIVESAIQSASEWMFLHTGQRFSGVCETVERPCGCSCGCGLASYGQASLWGAGCGCSPLCGCDSLSTVALTYGPVTDAEVTIDGAAFTDFVVLPPNLLMRTDGEQWPTCQSYTSNAVGWLVTYEHGEAPPELAKLAASDLTAEILRSCSGGDCALPPGTVNVTRRNVTMNLDPAQAGISLVRVGLALNAYPSQIAQPDVMIPGQRGLILT